MCEFHGSNGNGFGDIRWTDNLFYFSRPSIDGRAMRCRGLHAGSGDERHLTCERSWPFSSTSHTHKLPWGSQWLRTDVTLHLS